MFTMPYGAPSHAQELVQETDRTARELQLLAVNILVTFQTKNPKGPSPTKKHYAAGEKGLHKVLLEAFQSYRHGGCDLCDQTITNRNLNNGYYANRHHHQFS